MHRNDDEFEIRLQNQQTAKRVNEETKNVTTQHTRGFERPFHLFITTSSAIGVSPLYRIDYCTYYVNNYLFKRTDKKIQ